MLNVIPSMFVLGLAALAALRLVLNRWSPPENATERLVAARALAFAIAVQSIHFAEEAATGFHERLGAVFGLPGMPFSGFVVFNVTWIVIWVAAVPGLRSGRTAAFFVAWFLAIAAMANGMAHPLLAIADGRYFPGLVSSPLIAVAGVWLWLRLSRATLPRDQRTSPSSRSVRL